MQSKGHFHDTNIFLKDKNQRQETSQHQMPLADTRKGDTMSIVPVTMNAPKLTSFYLVSR